MSNVVVKRAPLEYVNVTIFNKLYGGLSCMYIDVLSAGLGLVRGGRGNYHSLRGALCNPPHPHSQRHRRCVAGKDAGSFPLHLGFSLFQSKNCFYGVSITRINLLLYEKQ